MAILATVANSYTNSLLHEGHDLAVALTKGFERAFLVDTGLALVGFLLTAVLISNRDSRAHRLASGGQQLAPAEAANS